MGSGIQPWGWNTESHLPLGWKYLNREESSERKTVPWVKRQCSLSSASHAYTCTDLFCDCYGIDPDVPKKLHLQLVGSFGGDWIMGELYTLVNSCTDGFITECGVRWCRVVSSCRSLGHGLAVYVLPLFLCPWSLLLGCCDVRHLCHAILPWSHLTMDLTSVNCEPK